MIKDAVGTTLYGSENKSPPSHSSSDSDVEVLGGRTTGSPAGSDSGSASPSASASASASLSASPSASLSASPSASASASYSDSDSAQSRSLEATPGGSKRKAKAKARAGKKKKKIVDTFEPLTHNPRSKTNAAMVMSTIKVFEAFYQTSLEDKSIKVPGDGRVKLTLKKLIDACRSQLSWMPE